MTQQQADSNARTNAGDTQGDRQSHATNQRVEQLRGGLEKAVSGRETVIKAQALKWAERLDERTQGRHHNKIRVALKTVEFIVDNAARKRDGGASDGAGRASDGADRASSFGSFGDVRGTNRSSGNGPGNLGEFRNLNDEQRSA